MTLHLTGHVALPEHKSKCGFDHAAVHAASGNVYVAHTANDAVDVFDPVSRRYLFSIPGLPGVAGALVSDEGGLILSSNRAANTIGVFAPGPNPSVRIIDVGRGPNGLAYDPRRPRQYCIIDGAVTARILKAYGKLNNSTRSRS